jgi:peptidoglycan/xylan/chitin deacetylase (PgdA/CDA1 family)
MRPTIIITFDDPELETVYQNSTTWKGHSVFALLGFTGKVGWYRESLGILRCYSFPNNIVLFLTYLFYIVYTKFRKARTIFDILRDNNVRATFFGLAINIDPERRHLGPLYYNPAIFEAIIKNGHELGLHGYHHSEPTPSDIERAIKLYKEILGTTPKVYSTPHGADNKRIEQLLHDYDFIGWRAWKYDSDFRKKPYTVRYVTKIDRSLLDEVIEKNEVLAWNMHMPDIFPLFPKKANDFENILKEIKKRDIWMPTFMEFCEYIRKSDL